MYITILLLNHTVSVFITFHFCCCSLLTYLLHPCHYNTTNIIRFHIWENTLRIHTKPFYIRALARLPLVGIIVLVAVSCFSSFFLPISFRVLFSFILIACRLNSFINSFLRLLHLIRFTSQSSLISSFIFNL